MVEVSSDKELGSSNSYMLHDGANCGPYEMVEVASNTELGSSNSYMLHEGASGGPYETVEVASNTELGSSNSYMLHEGASGGPYETVENTETAAKMHMDSVPFGMFTILHILISLSTIKTVSAVDPPCRVDRDKWEASCRDLGLSSVPRNLPGDTVNLDLSFNKITSLYNTSFLVYKQLRVLEIIGNDILFIESGTFFPLSFLQGLDLSDNPRLPVLRGDMFGTTNPLTIQLKRCNLISFSDDLFRAMVTTSNLELEENALQTINWTNCHNMTFHYVSLKDNKFAELSEQSFVMDCSVNSLILTLNPIRLVSPATISSLKVRNLVMSELRLPDEELQHLFQGVGSSSTIISLRIALVGLDFIRPGLFDALRGKQLRRIDLSFNRLRQLNPRGFENLTGVERLYLDSNDLETIEPSYFGGMSSLRVLSLANNHISVINVNSYMWNVNLTLLNLMKNKFVRIGDHAFNGLTNLKVLDLSGNNLNPLNHVTLSDLESLKTLNVADCINTGVLQLKVHSLKILNFTNTTEIDPSMFSPGKLQRNTPLLQEINFMDSDLIGFDLWDDDKEISSFVGLHKLRELNLNGVDMSYIFNEMFQNLTSLRNLYIDGSALDIDVYDTLLKGLSSLQIVSLEKNSIDFVPEYFLNDTVQLRELSLASNDVVFLYGNLFRNVVNLTRLDLSSNRLLTLQFTAFEPVLLTLSVLSLEQNQWVCNCSLEWLPKWIAQNSVKLEDSPRCSYEGSFRSAASKLLIDFDPVRECGSHYLLYSSVVVSALCGTLICLILIYHNRWKIGYGIFLCKIHFIGYREIVPQQQREDWRYDMYVITHDEDEEWTGEIFRRGLEENLPEYGRLAIGDEALTLGMYYLDSVSRLVETSFKVIFLISANALKNHMFLLKFRIALDHVNEVQVEKIVLVFLQEIPNADLPFLFRLFLSDNRAYLMWPQDPEGQVYFWEKLGRYMNVNRDFNPLVPP
ncbi:uncharacterized protein [Diadema setosum]|uniref:uncharacterized protein n=1 Tax=Diadema setosum TaxID=31175 RepID=UPI003B3B54F5